MAWLALGLYLVYLGTAFGVRSWLQWRHTGSTGFRGVSGRPGSLEWWGGALFVLALVLGLAAPALQLAEVVSPLAFAGHLAGAALAACGIVGTLLAQQAMGTSWRIGVDEAEATTLVTDGPFARVRNPIFTAMIATATGLTVLTPNVVALAGLAALVGAIEIQVRAVEEPYLLRTHGEAYRHYVSRSGRFLPPLVTKAS
ncbi:methyltransferase family protein [Lentzea sp. CA-135723]|uniref:methyltransferase family protein n=1 Tax=Lentzea sp. CA-135723 TaxID=3239950 RepID=UPI003D8E7B6E